MWRLSARKISASVSCPRLISRPIGRTGRAYASTEQPDAKVVSSTSAGSEQHVPPSPAQPPQPTRRGGSGLLWKVIGLSIVGAGGLVGYAWYDPDFRKSVEDRIPNAKQVLDYTFEYLPSPKSTQPVPLPPTKPSQIVKQTKSAAPDVKNEAEDKSTATTEPTEESVLSTEEIEEIELKEKKRREKKKLEQAVNQRETEEATENAELEGQLEKLLGDSRSSVAAAVTTLKSAASVVRDNRDQIRRAMEVSGHTDDWQLTTDVRPPQSEAVWMSDAAAEYAKSDLDRLRSAVTDARSKKSTQRNQILLPTEDELSRLSYSLSLAVSELNKAKSEEKVVMEYRGRVKQARDQFRKELESVVPDMKISPRLDDGQLTADELNSLIAHAHRRTEQLEKQLAEQQSAEQRRVEVVLGQHKEEHESLAEERLKQERQKMQAELEMLKQQWVEETEVDKERELRSQLSRQAAAHSDHVKDVLRVQQHELQTAFDVRLAGLVDRERTALQQNVARWTGRMQGIDKALTDRVEFDKVARRAQELWLACQTLHSIITEGDPDAKGLVWEDRLKPLQPELEVITAALLEKSELVSTVIGRVPETAVTRGVWTESALAERFARVRSVARRVAMIDESGGSLFRYIVSYVMSAFVFRQPLRAEAAHYDSDAELISPDELTTFVLLDRAADALERGSLEQAVRYVNQLRGESRHVASDWLREARLLLETRQAAEVLVSFAVANSLGALA